MEACVTNLQLKRLVICHELATQIATIQSLMSHEVLFMCLHKKVNGLWVC